MDKGEINACRICGNRELLPVIDLGVHALSSIFPAKHEPDPISAPLELVKCSDENNENACGLLQLKHTVPPEIMYLGHYGYRSGINKTMREHLRHLANEAESKANLSPGDVVLDIGSNDCTLLKFYTHHGLKKIGIDPTGNQFKEYYPEDVILLSEFFNLQNFRKVSPDKKAKIITSIAMFYDLQEPMKFVLEIKECLHKEGIWILEQSYMPTMLETNSFDTICHEHLEYYTLKQVQWMAKKAGLRILDVNFNNTNGGSFRATLSHNDSLFKSADDKIAAILKEEDDKGLMTLKPYAEFRQRIESIKEQIKGFIHEKKKTGHSIYIYGASTKGNTLLQYFGIGNDLITAAADRNPEKYGRRTPKTNIPIISEEEARSSKPDNFLVLPWHFKEEFLEREREYLESGGKLIFPLPKFEVITKDNLNKHVETKKKRVLITGITGQIGSYLAEILLEKGYEVHGIVRRTSSLARERIDHLKGLHLLYGDMGDSGSIEKIIMEVEPDEIYNLAAQSHVWISFQTPEYTSDVNALGVLRICEAARKLKKPVKIYQASTSELFGGVYNYPVNEETPFYPKSPYGVSKLYGYWIIRHYRETYNMFCSNGIVFNSESSRRGENFVTRKITKTVAEIVKGRKEILALGNLNAKRDWNHAKDTALAIWLIVQAEKPGDYVVASGGAHSVREFAEAAFSHAGIEIAWKGEGIDEIGYDKKTGKKYVMVDPYYFRPSEVNVLIGDSTKIRRELGWAPSHSFSQLVSEMMEHELKNTS